MTNIILIKQYNHNLFDDNHFDNILRKYKSIICHNKQLNIKITSELILIADLR